MITRSARPLRGQVGATRGRDDVDLDGDWIVSTMYAADVLASENGDWAVGR